jgi:hypothetical protein
MNLGTTSSNHLSYDIVSLSTYNPGKIILIKYFTTPLLLKTKDQKKIKKQIGYS